MEIQCAFVRNDWVNNKVTRIMWRKLAVDDNGFIIRKHRGRTLAYDSCPFYTFFHQGKPTMAFYDERALPMPPSEFFKINNLGIKSN